MIINTMRPMLDWNSELTISDLNNITDLTITTDGTHWSYNWIIPDLSESLLTHFTLETANCIRPCNFTCEKLPTTLTHLTFKDGINWNWSMTTGIDKLINLKEFEFNWEAYLDNELTLPALPSFKKVTIRQASRICFYPFGEDGILTTIYNINYDDWWCRDDLKQAIYNWDFWPMQPSHIEFTSHEIYADFLHKK